MKHKITDKVINITGNIILSGIKFTGKLIKFQPNKNIINKLYKNSSTRTKLKYSRAAVI